MRYEIGWYEGYDLDKIRRLVKMYGGQWVKIGKQLRQSGGHPVVTFTTDDINCVKTLEKALGCKITIRQPYIGWLHVLERHLGKLI